MSFIKLYDKRVGITYVYETYKVPDPDTGKDITKRRLIGKLDPDTNEIVPTGKRGPKPRERKTAQDAPVANTQMESKYKHLYEASLKELEATRMLLHEQRQKNQALYETARKASDILRSVQSQVDDSLSASRALLERASGKPGTTE